MSWRRRRPDLRPDGPWRIRVAAAFLALGGLVSPVPALAGDTLIVEAPSALALTVYNNDLALVSERRRVSLAAGENRLALPGVSRELRPETMRLSAEGARVLEQSFEQDVISQRRLLERSLGKRVWIRRHGESETFVEATLVSVFEQPVVRVNDRLETVAPGLIAFPAERRGDGLHARPTVLATLASETAGERDLALTYLSRGLAWQADYTAEVDEDSGRLDLTGSVTLSNASGTAFADASLRLVAGDVHQVGDLPQPRAARALGSMAEAAMAAPDLVRQAVGELHLYAVDRRVSLADREIKQITLLTARSVPFVREYRFEDLINAHGGPEETGPVNAATVLGFKNDAASGLGRPLPGGVIRIYRKADAAAGTVFLGEDRIRHTAEGTDLRLTTGRAFDVTGKARRTAFERLSERSYETAQEITLRNAKAEQAVAVEVVGVFPQGWRMIEESAPHEAQTANRLAWTLTVPAQGEATLSYRVRVTRP